MTIVPHPRFRPDDLARHVADFLADLEQADRSPHTRRAYAADLRHFAAHQRGALADVDAAALRGYFATGLRIGEALGVHAEDLDLTADDERLTVTGKGGRRRTILLDDPALVRELRAHLAAGGRDPARARGPLFRALKGGRGGPLRYQSIHERWARYCAAAGVDCTIHQLRHSHATELVNGGVGLETIRRRLGHKNLQTTLRYAEQRDQAGDAEVRAWRRRRGAGR